MSRDEALDEFVMVATPGLWGYRREMTFRGEVFVWNEYQLRRIELISEPDDADAPEWARFKAQDSDGEWYWYDDEPKISSEWQNWDTCASGVEFEFSHMGAIPAGHDWRETLMPVNQDAQQDAAHLDAQLAEAIQDTGKHYRREYKGIKLDPYRVCRVYEMEGGPREQATKKLLRGTTKGDTERQVIKQVRDALTRWEEMLDEDGIE